MAATWALRLAAPVTYPGTSLLTRSMPLVAHLTVGTLAYSLGYLLTGVGRGDAIELSRKLLRRGGNA